MLDGLIFDYYLTLDIYSRIKQVKCANSIAPTDHIYTKGIFSMRKKGSTLNKVET